MRKRYRVLLIAAVVAALVVPVGYALSLEPQPPVTVLARTTIAKSTSATVVASPLVLHEPTSIAGNGPASPLRSMPDAGKLFLAGTVLFGLSALVRKAI